MKKKKKKNQSKLTHIALTHPLNNFKAFCKEQKELPLKRRGKLLPLQSNSSSIKQIQINFDQF